LIRRGRDPSVGITVSQATITLRVTAHGATPHEALATMQPTIATIHECLGSLVFGEEDDELQHSVLRLLCEQNATLATCEWGTGGLLAHWLHEAAGHEGRYLGGLVVGDEFAVRRIVGVSWRPADQGGDEEQFVREMAVTARQQTAAYYGLAVGPFPALQPAAADPPLFYIALATPDEVVTVKPLPFAGHPDILTPRAAKAALNLLRLALLRGA